MSTTSTGQDEEDLWCKRIESFLTKRGPREWFLFSNICAEVPRGTFVDRSRKSFTVVKEDPQQRFATRDGQPGMQYIKLREPHERVVTMSTVPPWHKSASADAEPSTHTHRENSEVPLHSPIVVESDAANNTELSLFRPGTRCKIEGTKKVELNGKIGIVASGVEAEKEKGFGRVLLHVGLALVSLLPERLIIVTPTEARGDAADSHHQSTPFPEKGGSAVTSPPVSNNSMNPSVWIPEAVSKIVPCIISNLSSWAGEKNSQFSNRGYSEEDLRKWAAKPTNSRYLAVGMDNFIPPIWHALKKHPRLHAVPGPDGVVTLWCSSDIDGPTGPPNVSSAHSAPVLPVPVDAWIVKAADACIEAALIMLSDPEKPRPFEQSRVEKRVLAALKGGSLSPLPSGISVSDVTQRVCQRISNDSRLIVKPFYKLPHYFASSPEFGMTTPAYPKKGAFQDGAIDSGAASSSSSLSKKASGPPSSLKEEFLVTLAQKYAKYALNALKGLAGIESRTAELIRPYTIGRLKSKILEKEDIPSGISLDNFVKLIWPKMALEKGIKESLTADGELCYVLPWMISGARRGGDGDASISSLTQETFAAPKSSVPDDTNTLNDSMSHYSNDEYGGTDEGRAPERRESIDSELTTSDDTKLSDGAIHNNNNDNGHEEETDRLLYLAGIREIWDEESQTAAMNRPLEPPSSPSPTPPGLALPHSLGQYPSSLTGSHASDRMQSQPHQFFNPRGFDATAHSLSLPKSFFFDASKGLSTNPTVDLADGESSKHQFKHNRALLGSVEIVEQPIYLNTAEQFCCVTIGDKDCINYMLSIALESCLLPFSDADVPVVAIEKASEAKSVLVFTLDHPSIVCDAAGLAFQNNDLAASLTRSGSSIKPPFLPQSQIKVLASPFFYKQRQYHYGPAYSVRPITFKWSRLSVDHIKRILRIKESVQDATSQNNQFASVVDVLRKYQKGSTRPNFSTFCEEIKRLASYKHSDSQLPQRLRLLESIVFESAENASIAVEWPKICDHVYAPGSLMIVDLTDPLLSISDANCIFQVFAEQFRSEQRNSHTEKLLAVHNVQNFMDPVGSGGLADILITFAQQKVMRLFVSATSPHSMPTALLESCTVAVLHRFHSREWLRSVAKALPINDAAFERFVSLQLGHAIIFGSRCSIQDIELSPFGYNVFPIRLRPKLTGAHVIERRSLAPHIN